MRTCLFVAPAALCLVSCGTMGGGSAAKADFPVGNWLSEDRVGDGIVVSATQFRPDGRYASVVRQCAGGQSRDHTESGHWKLSGDMLTMAVETDEGRSVDFTIRLKTLSNDGHIWVSQVAGGGPLPNSGSAVTKSRRVGADARLPDCDAS
ncbi:MAG TPA: hypothetical protein VHU23_17175 [Rhizomicrobium sp.]|nr:hypothetical protein [Rhizomicrobium sp.]